jgi:D-galacturonate reductase
MEVHKRWDPIYADARDRIRQLGEFSYFSSFMSQPKSQLETFRSWAGRSSDISYYLNAHHVDFNLWSVSHIARPLFVTALASCGVARAQGIDAEDTIHARRAVGEHSKWLTRLGVLHGKLDRP